MLTGVHWVRFDAGSLAKLGAPQFAWRYSLVLACRFATGFGENPFLRYGKIISDRENKY
jgi:hypothetical protein